MNFEDDFSPDDVVKSYYEHKNMGLQKMRVQVIIDVLKRRGKMEDGKFGGYLLDVGCAHGEVTRLLASYFKHAIGIDPSCKQIAKANTIENPHQIDFKAGIAENLPVADGSIDVITAVYSLHFTNLEVFIKECKRVLRADGIALFYMGCISSITSTEYSMLPVVKNELKAMHDLCLGTAKDLSHPERHVRDYYQALYNLIDFPNKTKVEIESEACTSLEALRRYLLTIPFYRRLGTDCENPVIALMQTIKELWSMKDKDEKVIGIQLSYRSVVITLGPQTPH